MHPLTLPKDWPHRQASRHIASTPHLWHVQIIGAGPDLLLLHGAGGATHSWRHLMPLLADRYRVIALDLPGQGFSRSGARGRSGLDPMAADIAALCAKQGWHPAAIIGHSAGAALALRLAELMQVRAVIGVNAALGSFEGLAGWLFPAMAKVLAMTPMAGHLFSMVSGTRTRAQSLIDSTGSNIDPAGLSQYLTLLRNAGHVDATLAMMAQWRLDALLTRLPAQTVPCLLITSDGDLTVPPVVSQRAAAQLRHAQWVDIPGYGHLVHEENASAVAALILPFLAAHCGG